MVRKIEEHLQPILLLLEREVAFNGGIQACGYFSGVLSEELGPILNILNGVEYAEFSIILNLVVGAHGIERLNLAVRLVV